MKKLGLACFLLLPACDAEEQCVADCQASSSTGSSSDDTAGDPPESSGGEDLACEQANDAALDFVETNRACETLLDCIGIDALCFSEGMGACGSVAVSANADLGEWDTINGELNENCLCGADPCGASVMCTDGGECDAVWLSDDYCPSVERDIETFVAANKQCETAADCISVYSSCHVDNCAEIAFNLDTDLDAWEQLNGEHSACALESADPENYCNFVGDCGVEIVCTDEGQCMAEF